MTRLGLVRSSSLFFVSAALLFVQHATAQTTHELQQQIQEMKQLYEQQISTLEGRIASLEQANRAAAHAVQENTISVTDLHTEVEKQVTARRRPRSSRPNSPTLRATTPYRIRNQ